MKIPTTPYAEFTPDERLQLTLAALERRDGPEIDRLARSCPQETRVVLDPRYIVRYSYLQAAVSAEIILWMDVSAMVLLSPLTIESFPSKDVALRAKADAAWKTWSTLWRSVEAGISKFCADAGLTCDQLLALAGGRRTAIECAGRALHPNARAGGRAEKAVRQRLWHVWRFRSEG
jgi:hypothetical protein